MMTEQRGFSTKGRQAKRLSCLGGGLLLTLAVSLNARDLRADEKPQGAKDAAAGFIYPAAKQVEVGREGSQIYHVKFVTPDSPQKVVEWYRLKAGLVKAKKESALLANRRKARRVAF